MNNSIKFSIITKKEEDDRINVRVVHAVQNIRRANSQFKNYSVAVEIYKYLTASGLWNKTKQTKSIYELTTRANAPALWNLPCTPRHLHSLWDKLTRLEKKYKALYPNYPDTTGLTDETGVVS